MQNNCWCLGTYKLYLEICVNRDISPTCNKARKSRHFTKVNNNRYNLQKNHVNWVISVQCDKASTKKTEAVFGTFHLFLEGKKVPGKVQSGSKGYLFARTFYKKMKSAKDSLLFSCRGLVRLH